MMLLSQILGRPIRDAGGERIATLVDLVGRLHVGRRLAVRGLLARVGSRRFFIPWQQVAELDADGVRLSSYRVNLQQFEREPRDLLLAADVMDQRLIDVRHRRVIRANDVALLRSDDRMVVEAVDVGFTALLRRLVPRALSQAFLGTTLVNWSDLEWLPSEAVQEAKHTFPLLARLHPVEVAHIVDELPHRQGADIVESLDDDDAAEVLSEVSDEHQLGVLMNLDDERAADILEEMEPDDAADILGRLPPDDADELLHRMEEEEARDVQHLMEYREGTAGGLMTSRFVAVPQSSTASEAIGLLRRMEERPETVTHLLVVDQPGSERLIGMVGLLELVVAAPRATLRDFMMRDVPTVGPGASTSEVARKMADYDLAVIPVVDDEGTVRGVVAVDDIVEEMLPERWRRRLPRLFGR